LIILNSSKYTTWICYIGSGGTIFARTAFSSRFASAAGRSLNNHRCNIGSFQ
jgi:hypothetical protein